MKDNEIENFFEGKFEIPQFDRFTANQARKLQNQLTKPVGSLGKLEDLGKIGILGKLRKLGSLGKLGK